MTRLLTLLALTLPISACGLFGGDGPELTFSSAYASHNESLVLGRDTVFVRPDDADEYWSIIDAIRTSRSFPPFSVDVIPGGVRIDGYFLDASANRFGGSVRRAQDGVEITVWSRPTNQSVVPFSTNLNLYRAEVVSIEPGGRIVVVHQNDIYNTRRAGYPGHTVKDFVVLDTVLTTVP